MSDDLPSPSDPNDPSKTTDAIPRGLTAAGGLLFGLDFLVDFVLGIISIALGTWYALRRPGIAVLIVAILLASYVLIHLWRHVTEHPRRAPGYRRRQRARPES